MRAVLRVSVVLFIALGAFLFSAGDIVDPWYPWSTFGFTTDSSGTVSTVDEYASARGVRVGDVVNLSAMPLSDRAQLGPTP
ncbi:MAG TPA: hypothetical protein VGN11_11700, partial [Candidatus Baltobacteraceae bacterium]|nr:hypothetical protein [Candidatus Baltobacteraceae bacterium]